MTAAKILVIDDSLIAAKILKKFLSDIGLQVETADNGRTGVSKAVSFNPELIFCDIEMPYKNGIEFLEEKQKNPQIKNIPVIMLTISQDEEKVRKAIALGAIDYLSKPVHLTAIYKRINATLNLNLQLKKDNKTETGVFYDSGIIFVNFSGSLLAGNILPIKYKLIEIANIYNVKRIKILFLLESLKNETINTTSISYLFSVLEDEDFPVSHENVSVVTSNEKFYNVFKETNYSKSIFISPEYMAGVNRLQFNKNYYTGLEVEKIFNGSILHYDLYDEKGNVIIEAGIPITNKIKRSLTENGTKVLFYRDKTSESTPDIRNDFTQFVSLDTKNNELLQNKKILFIEDSKLLRVQLGKFLEDRGFKVLYASNGETGLDLALKENPDLILLDIILPHKNGLAVLQEFRKIDNTTPVVILTEITNESVVRKARSLKISSFLSKPFKALELFRKINAIIGSSIELD